MSRSAKVTADILTAVHEWDAERGLIFIRTHDDRMRQSIHRHLLKLGIPNVNIFTLGDRLDKLLEENKLVAVTSTMVDAARFTELAESKTRGRFSQRIFRLEDVLGNSKTLEPVEGEIVIRY